MEHIFIINPVSGKKDATAEMLPKIRQAAERCGVAPQTVLTKAPKHATELARQHAHGGAPVRLYAVGGDGTLNEVLAGAYLFGNAEVACVPCGSGNDFIRSFGVASDFLDIEGQIQGAAVPIDLMQVDGGICAAIASTGLDAEVAYNIPKYRRLPLLGGGMAYNISILEQLLHPLGKHLRVVLDGEEIQDRYLIAAVCNAQSYGGGYRAAPLANLHDGMLDVILVKKVSRLLIASIIGKYKKGEHFSEGEIIPKLRHLIAHHRVRHVEIYPTGSERFILNVDGECAPAPRLVAEVLPNAARFVLPHAVRQAYTGMDAN